MTENTSQQEGPEKIGLYGGSFDPIHIGHLILAREAKEQLGLNQVIFLPARISPHKLTRPPAPAQARLEMVAEAIKDEPGFALDDWEIRREGPSYAIITARHMKGRFPKASLYYFIGDDNLPELDSWREIAALQEIVRFVVFSRHENDTFEGFPTIHRRVDISSTDIRNRIAQGLSVRYLVPDSAWHIIETQRLYRDD